MSPETAGSLVAVLARDTSLGSITLFGGEPLGHPQIVAIARIVGKFVPVLAMTTSAASLTPLRRQELQEAGVRHFEVSLDTIDAEVHQSLRGGDVARVRRAILDLVRAGADVTVSAVLTRPSLPGLADLLDFCAVAGVEGLSLLRPLGPVPVSLVPTNGELEAALRTCDAWSARSGIPVACSVPCEPCLFDVADLKHVRLVPCRCGVDKWYVDPVGRLFVCELAPVAVGDLTRTSFPELAADERVRAFREAGRSPECTSCGAREVCGGGCRFLGGSAQRAP